MLKIGLTGGIGCGKTTVADLFAAKGVPVLDADVISRELVEPGQPALEAIVRRFGPDLLVDGRLDRTLLRRLIFAQPDARHWLESLIHPLVYETMARRSAGLSGPYCLLVVPLLLETGQRGFVDRLLVVDCPPEIQRRRVKARDGSDDAEVERILSAQLSREDRLAAADDLIENSSDLAFLSAQIDQLHRCFLNINQG
ncbi:dephospho-CoA kinase [Methylomagnum sp.]